MRPIDLPLWPVSFLYGAANHLRARAYRTGLLKSRRLDAVVISVGNLTVGGTGKTPMVLWIAQKLLAEGKSVGILTRGYRGQPVPVTAGDEIGTAEEIKITNSSDEVQLLAARLGNHVRFGVGANRFENGSKLAAQGVNWFVLDDGFQHWHLERNVDLVLIDAMTPFGGGQLLPAGRLREPLTALARADIVVITRTESSPGVETTIRQYSSAPIFYAQPQLDSIRKIEAGRLAGPVSSGAADRLFVFCAIGNPNGFIQTLTQSGVTISGRKFFPDHHRFTRADADQILRAAQDAGSTGLICTEKDLYNLGGSFGDESNLFCATISLKIQHQDDFWHQIISKANDRAAASASKEDC